MKSTEDYINKVYEKFEETERNHQYYKRVKINGQNNFLYAMVTCLTLIIVAIGVTVNFKNKVNNNISNDILYAENNGTKVYTEYLKIDYNEKIAEENFNNIIRNSDIIAIVTGQTDEGCVGKIKNKKVIIQTIKKLELSNIYKNSQEIYNNEIKYIEVGGKLLIEDLEKELDYNWEEWENNIAGKILSYDEKKITYFEQILIKGVKLENQKEYLAFLEYDNETNSYVLSDYVYGALEYDSNTNMVKNPITGEFEEFDWSLLENQ